MMARRPTLVLLVLAGLCGVAVADDSTGACQDTVLCKLYARDICSDPQYESWVHAHCRRYCGRCVPSVQAQVGVGKLLDEGDNNPQCKDAIANCASYGTTICQDVKFFSWVNENCMAHCSRCNNVCTNKVPNCAEYGETLCTELAYYNWVEMNCRKHCARCHS